MTGTGEPVAALQARRRYFPAVEGMRALAALAVLFGHVLDFGYPSGSTQQIFGYWTAAFGVVVFFAISGFLLYRPFVAARREAEEGVWRLSGPFLWRRAVRIVPAYWVALTVLAVWPGLPGVFTSHWWAYYGFLQIYSAESLGNGIGAAWSLCVEATFYLALPLVAAFLATRGVGSGRPTALRWELGALAALAAASLAWRTLAPGGPGDAYLTVNLAGTFVWFTGGMALAAIQVAHPSRLERARRLLSRPEICWPLGLAVFLALPLELLNRLGPSASVLVTFSTLAMGVAAALLAAPSMLGDSDRAVTVALSNKLAVFVGTVSYGIYLWHAPILEKLLGSDVVRNTPTPTLVTAALTLAASVALGAASWYAIERPLMRRARSAKAFSRIGRQKRLPAEPLAERGRVVGEVEAVAGGQAGGP